MHLIIGLTSENENKLEEFLTKNAVLQQPYSLIKTNDRGEIVYVNDTACDLYQYTNSDLINKTHSLLRSVNTTSKVLKS